MRKITFLTLCFSFVANMANATNYFVDFTKSDDAGVGTSWEAAKKTVAAASALGAPGDNIYIKAGTLNTSAQVLFVADKNYYGSCDAANKGVTVKRSLSDLDANGMVEPWEFTNPTLFSSTYSTYKGAFVGSTNCRIDGFVFTLTYLKNATNASLFGGIGSTVTFTNNTIRNCNMSCKVTGSYWGLFLTIGGTASNCLIENNTLAITSTATFHNGTARGLLLVNSGAKASNFIIRNNLLNYDFSTILPTATANGNMGGLIVHLNGGGNSVVKNMVINNNEINFTGATTPALPTATDAAVLSSAGTIATDSILNCTVANNKTTNLFSAGIYFKSSNPTLILQAYNNVAFNNQNNSTLSNISTKLAVQNGGLFSNNFSNGAGLMNASRITNNDNTQTATDNSVFKFKNPTAYLGLPIAYAGNPVGQSVMGSNWSLNSGSYLIAKGMVASNVTDFTAKVFADPRSVGAYEFSKSAKK